MPQQLPTQIEMLLSSKLHQKSFIQKRELDHMVNAWSDSCIILAAAI